MAAVAAAPGAAGPEIELTDLALDLDVPAEGEGKRGAGDTSFSDSTLLADGSASASASASCTPEQPPAVTDIALHMVLGMGTGWALADAVFIETAVMQEVLPEGLNLIIYITMAGMISNAIMSPAFIAVQSRLRWYCP